jgi:hypothetical protein
MRAVILTAAIVLALFSASAPTAAHELGPARVHVTFANGQFEIAIVGDPSVLLARLDALAASTETIPVERMSANERLVARSAVLLQHIQLRVDGADILPSLEPVFRVAPEEEPASDGSPSPARAIVLHGPLPPNARTFSWRCGLLFGSYPLVVSGTAQSVVWVSSNTTTDPIPITMPVGERRPFLRYLQLGFVHIVPGGLDHVLFVLGLSLLSTRLRDVVTQVSAFTAAHCATLALSLYGVISVPAIVVEPLIALSIVYVAVENLFVSKVRTHRLAVVFAFGLLHGLGFAGVLTELGLPAGRVLAALVGFNVGVELGQLSVVTGAFAAAWLFRAHPAAYRRFLAVPASIVIAVTGFIWSISRVLG